LPIHVYPTFVWSGRASTLPSSGWAFRRTVWSAWEAADPDMHRRFSDARDQDRTGFWRRTGAGFTGPLRSTLPRLRIAGAYGPGGSARPWALGAAERESRTSS